MTKNKTIYVPVDVKERLPAAKSICFKNDKRLIFEEFLKDYQHQNG
jgi:hypothetical protein